MFLPVNNMSSSVFILFAFERKIFGIKFVGIPLIRFVYLANKFPLLF